MVSSLETNNEGAGKMTEPNRRGVWRKPDPQRTATLWLRPVIANEDVPAALDIPASLWQTLKRAGDCPPLFLLGARRLYVRTSDLRAWLDRKAEGGAPGTRPRPKRDDDASASEAPVSAGGE
jgi:hypothetical protein